MKSHISLLLVMLFAMSSMSLYAQDNFENEEILIDSAALDLDQDGEGLIQQSLPKSWTDRIKVSGYIQARYNGLFETNPDLEVPQMDKNWGADKGISLRRVRLKVSGWLLDNVYMYMQADFAGAPSLRDAYMDVYFDHHRSTWIRVGQSKVPFGYENMQSSQFRMPLDRTDAINSALPNERDLMAVLYHTPQKVRKIYNYMKENNLKHSGNYGTFALGAFNGQGINTPDANDNLHVVGRASWPFQLANNQIIEVSAHAYTGKYILPNVTDGMMAEVSNNGKSELVEAAGYNFNDSRVGATFVYYPQPIGFQFEANYGVGPEYDAAENVIKEKNLFGFYGMVFAKINYDHHTFFPFVRYINYDGGKKFELDARSYKVDDWEIGVEWQPNRAFEFVAMYTIANRSYVDSKNPVNDQAGNLLRLQMQVNF
ncbi:OprO/OprP family phosphate-selective porin [Flammeovirga yaeyamensis]|uniref:OprO/OprP family phosphate-selective porin n=1 Tax=Flammeovirga yaeyamensis TaxID=367791 RepID=A0AAX1N053_9BACT|nr:MULTISPECIES: porin [Flammeovirga]ANQ47706.1 porin [Flammeovirga sp. MY04]MBB3700170.1 phosphate-selective porin [Flammeovirga yaeyamensis]NMF37200.1 porin [Flammeovirga yaeyamensis]QWG00889.1 OprO/OprP family phosphate-selective porin [Flammeovirga yaeyamensis]